MGMLIQQHPAKATTLSKRMRSIKSVESEDYYEEIAKILEGKRYQNIGTTFERNKN